MALEMTMFGWKLERQVKDTELQQQANNVSFVPQDPQDGSLIVADGGAYGTYVDIEGSVRSDAELITRYRIMSEHPELDTAITAIVNESIINEPDTDTVSIDLGKVEGVSDSIKEKIEKEFAGVLKLFNFNKEGYEMFRRWYIDGRMYYHAIFDQNNPGKGIQELRYIDPRKIRKVREVKPVTVGDPGSKNVVGGNVTMLKTAREYYVFNDRGFGGADISTTPTLTQAMAGIKIAKDNIIQVTSGLQDPHGKNIISYLNKAIKPLNMLSMMEDALVIYRVSRAPERRIFYVDTSGMPRPKADQYVQQLMVRFKNKVAYDSATGEIRDERKYSSMLEDFWLPRRDGGKGTEITTLPGGQNLGEIEDVMYMLKKLYKALSIPITRLDPEALFSIGRATEISRDEVSFEKFITRLRSRFSDIFLGALRLQLLTKKIINAQDWVKIKNDILFKYAEDNLFAELKQNEIMQARIGVANGLLPFAGKYVSHTQIRQEVFKQTEEQMKDIDKQIKKDATNPQYQNMTGEEDPQAGAFGASTGFDAGGPDQFQAQQGQPPQ
jgi:hypothetical protein